MHRLVTVLCLIGAAIWLVDLLPALFAGHAMSAWMWYLGFGFVAAGGLIELVAWLRTRRHTQA